KCCGERVRLVPAGRPRGPRRRGRDGRPRRPAGRAARDDCGPSLGRTDLRPDRRTERRLGQHGAPALPGRPRRAARTAACAVPGQTRTPALNARAGALAGLKPRPAALDRDALMFRAGRASAPRGWKWPLATAALSLVALGLGIALLVRPQPQVVERI